MIAGDIDITEGGAAEEGASVRHDRNRISIFICVLCFVFCVELFLSTLIPSHPSGFTFTDLAR